MAAVSCGTSHASTVSTPLRWIFQKRAIKSYSLMQNHMRAQWVCSKAENSTISKAINNNNNQTKQAEGHTCTFSTFQASLRLRFGSPLSAKGSCDFGVSANQWAFKCSVSVQNSQHRSLQASKPTNQIRHAQLISQSDSTCAPISQSDPSCVLMNQSNSSWTLSQTRNASFISQ